MDAVIVASGVWYAMFDTHDGNYDRVADKADLLPMLTIVIPWPSAYETLRTKFVKKTIALQRFEDFLRAPNIAFVDDASFRDAALTLCMESSLRRKRPLSMVDCLIRLMIDDLNTDIRYLATFNKRDFIDVCG